jgi:glucose/arabinose dehydrogenase
MKHPSLRRRVCVWVSGGALLATGLLLVGGCPTTKPVSPLPDDAPIIALTRIATGFTAPVALCAPDDGTGRLFVADQVGVIWVVKSSGTVLSTPLLDLRSQVATGTFPDERGLLGMALHPSFAANDRFYVFYTAAPGSDAPEGAATEVFVSEFRISASDPNVAEADTERVLLRMAKPQTNHNGGQLAFGPDGYLYIGVGDGGGSGDLGTGHTLLLGNAQDKTNLLGKILRIDPLAGDPYDTPSDNPYAGSSTARNEIYAYGFRNPWRFSFDVHGGTTRLFAGDVGQTLMEEIDLVASGGNYGWNRKEGSLCFDPLAPSSPPSTCASAGLDGAAFRAPLLEYRHTDDSGNAYGTAVVGGYVYRGSAVAALTGLYLFGDFSANSSAAEGKLFVGTEGTAGTWSFQEAGILGTSAGRMGRYLLGFGRDADGELYVLTRGSSATGTGMVHRVTGYTPGT